MIYFKQDVYGLIKAIDNFDNTLNVQFSTYAVPMIIGEIRRHLRDNNPIRVSRSMRDMAYKALQAKEKLFKETRTRTKNRANCKGIRSNKRRNNNKLRRDTRSDFTSGTCI